MDELLQKPLAFSSAPALVSATSRLPLKTGDNSALLNIEIFDSNTTEDAPILLLTHGVCASAETLGVQAIVSAAKDSNVKIAVLELEGHGLSSGKRNVCGDFDRLLGHVLEFAKHAVAGLRGNSEAPYFLTGNSLGGVLAIYAAEEISKKTDIYPSNFKGLATICPAVGVDERKLPSTPIILGLSILSYLAPTLQVSLTPLEDPSAYKCPADTKRNFEGHWPLATSKMLLDVTSSKVESDVKSKRISLKAVGAVLMFAGEFDDVVPLKSIKGFYDAVQSDDKKFIEIPKAGKWHMVHGCAFYGIKIARTKTICLPKGHDMMFYKSTSKLVTDALFQWIESSK